MVDLVLFRNNALLIYRLDIDMGVLDWWGTLESVLILLLVGLILWVKGWRVRRVMVS